MGVGGRAAGGRRSAAAPLVLVFRGHRQQAKNFPRGVILAPGNLHDKVLCYAAQVVVFELDDTSHQLLFRKVEPRATVSSELAAVAKDFHCQLLQLISVHLALLQQGVDALAGGLEPHLLVAGGLEDTVPAKIKLQVRSQAVAARLQPELEERLRLLRVRNHEAPHIPLVLRSDQNPLALRGSAAHEKSTSGTAHEGLEPPVGLAAVSGKPRN